MKSICAIGLTALLCCEPLAAAATGPSLTSPLAAAASREASRLAREPDADGGRRGWEAVERLQPQSRVVVTTADGLFTGLFVAADASSIRIDRNGAIEQVDADAVQTVEKRVRRGSAVASTLGALGGLWLGSVLAMEVGLSARCQPNCGGVELGMVGMVVGFPIAAGYGAWRGTSHFTEEIVYRHQPPRRR